MLDPVIDTQVLVIASGLSDQEAQQCHTDLLDLFRLTDWLHLAIDDHIKSEYDERMRHGSLGQQWLLELAKAGRIRKCERCRLDRGMQTALQEAHFDPDDIKFVRLAMATKSKYLVAEEDDYSNRVRRVLQRRIGVMVHSTEGICEIIRANQEGRPDV